MKQKENTSSAEEMINDLNQNSPKKTEKYKEIIDLGDVILEIGCNKKITKGDIESIKESTKQKLSFLEQRHKYIWEDTKKEIENIFDKYSNNGFLGLGERTINFAGKKLTKEEYMQEEKNKMFNTKNKILLEGTITQYKLVKEKDDKNDKEFPNIEKER